MMASLKRKRLSTDFGRKKNPKPFSALFELPPRNLLSLFPMVFHGVHGREGLHQVETCSKIVHLWCSVALLISESPGWEMISDWVTRATP